MPHLARTARLALPLLTTLLSGCLDFVDPIGLNLTREARLNVSFELRDTDLPCGGDFASAPVGWSAAGSGSPLQIQQGAMLCVEASLFPGFNRFGERLEVANDTLWVMDRPIVPRVGADSTRKYALGIPLPVDRLHEIPITARFPAMQGMAFEPSGIRWHAVGRVGPAQLTRTRDEPLVLRLGVPPGFGTPRPGQFWTMDVVGTADVVSFRGPGIPRPSYTFAPEALNGLGGNNLFAGFRWTQTYSRGVSRNYQIYVQLIQQMHWRISTTAPPPAPTGSDSAVY